MKQFLVLCLAIGIGAAISESAHAGLVDLSLNPETLLVDVGQLVFVELAAQTQGDPIASVAAIDAILDWDPAFLELVGISNTNNSYAWFVSDFLPDPDGINDDLSDGDALYTALSQVATPANVPDVPGWVVTTVVFRALSPISSTTVSLVATFGQFGETRVLDFFNPGAELTGSVAASADVTISQFPDVGPTLDVHPGSCPNPANVFGLGQIPVALVGSTNFDVSLVDPMSLRLMRSDGVGSAVAPQQSQFNDGIKIDDVATPFEGEACGCHLLKEDGVDDLLMFFASSSIASAMELYNEEHRSFIEVVLTGQLYDGTPIAVTDCVKVIRGGKISQRLFRDGKR